MADKSISDMNKTERKEAMKVETLPDGTTKGIVPDVDYELGDLPDYPLVVATNGKEGYVPKEVLEGDPPSPAEAQEWLRNRPASVPVLDSDLKQ